MSSLRSLLVRFSTVPLRSASLRPAGFPGWRKTLLVLPLLVACQWAAVPTAVVSPAAPATPADLLVASSGPRVQQLLAMTQHNISVINTTGVQKDVVLDSNKATALVRDFHIGSFLNGEAVPAAQWVRFSAALQRNGWDRTNALIPDQRLQDFLRPSFQAAIVSGLKSIIPNSGEILASGTRAG